MGNNRITRRNILSLLCFSPFLYAQSFDKERVWKDFLTWLKGKSLSGTVASIADVPKIYQDKLIADGITGQQIAQRMAIVNEFLLSRTEGMAIFFDDVYANRKDFFSRKPNQFLTQIVQDLKPGTALDVSMGEGRNSIFLAQKGWDVTGFDISDEGLSIAQRNAEKAGVKIKTILSGYQDFDFGKNQWDLVAMIYAFFPIYDKVYIQKLIDSIRPEGILAFEHLLYTGPSQYKATAGMVGMPGQNSLQDVFGSLKVLRYGESNANPDWTSGQSAPIVQLLAKKV
jgi:2-polyprenyl-3-methyl-5-hydroxy-6-metoxy-1,4-benzoquinol methylase